MWRSLASATALTALMAAPGLMPHPATAQQTPPPGVTEQDLQFPQDQQQQQQQEAARDQAQQKPGQAQPGQAQAGQTKILRVVGAEELVDRDVVTSEGQTVGEIDYVMVDVPTSKVLYVILGQGGTLGIGEELIAVPWQVVQATGDEDTIRLRVEQSFLANAPRVTRETIGELTQPMTFTRIATYYAPVIGQQGQQGQQQQTQQQQPGSQPGQQILVSRELITTVIPPALQTAGQIKGDELMSAQGEEIGRIDRLMVDLDTGRVPYMLVAQGGFLGMGEEWLPVPFAAVQWSPDLENYVLATAPARQAGQDVAGFPRTEDLPMTIRANQLADLYQRYNVEPYWE